MIGPQAVVRGWREVALASRERHAAVLQAMGDEARPCVGREAALDAVVLLREEVLGKGAKAKKALAVA